MKDYNFFSSYERRKGLDIDAKSPYFIGAIVIILCVALSLGLVLRNTMLMNQIESINMERQTIEATTEYTEAIALKSSIDAMTQYDQSAQAILNKFMASNVIGTDLLKSLSSKIPSTVTMTTFNLDNASANFSFTVPNRKAAAELLLSLKNTGLFLDVQLNSITSSPDGGGTVAFITAVMKEGVAK